MKYPTKYNRMIFLFSVLIKNRIYNYAEDKSLNDSKKNFYPCGPITVC